MCYDYFDLATKASIFGGYCLSPANRCLGCCFGYSLGRIVSKGSVCIVHWFFSTNRTDEGATKRILDYSTSLFIADIDIFLSF